MRLWTNKMHKQPENQAYVNENYNSGLQTYMMHIHAENEASMHEKFYVTFSKFSMQTTPQNWGPSDPQKLFNSLSIWSLYTVKI